MPASRMARYLSPVRRPAERLAATRPPSSGAPGSMLNTRQERVDDTEPRRARTWRLQTRSPRPSADHTPMARLTSGARRRRSSPRPGGGGLAVEVGDAAERPELDRLGLHAEAPCRSSAWPNSWARIDAKNATVATMPGATPSRADEADSRTARRRGPCSSGLAPECRRRCRVGSNRWSWRGSAPFGEHLVGVRRSTGARPEPFRRSWHSHRCPYATLSRPAVRAIDARRSCGRSRPTRRRRGRWPRR